MAAVSTQIGSTKIILIRGDITRQNSDAIVNAANSSLLGGGGVDGAIHRAGGAKILQECKAIRAQKGGCQPGEAVITSGGNLAARYVIHTVGPIYRGGTANEAQVLENAYRNSLSIAVDYQLKTIAFPSISTGAYGYPLAEAARIALTTVTNFARQDGTLAEIRFVLFDQFAFDAFSEALDSITTGHVRKATP